MKLYTNVDSFISSKIYESKESNDVLDNYEKELVDKLSKDDEFDGSTLGDIYDFLEVKINDYWVDAPVKQQTEMKVYSKKCKHYKQILKELKDFVKNQDLKFVYNKKTDKMDLVKK